MLANPTQGTFSDVDIRCRRKSFGFRARDLGGRSGIHTWVHTAGQIISILWASVYPFMKWEALMSNLKDY